MITRAFITEVISAKKVRVRIPLYDRIPKAGLSVQNKDLSVATICTPPNMVYNPQVGDVVFVGFEDYDMGKPVVIGYLLTDIEKADAEGNESSAPAFNPLSLNVSQSAVMPYNTNIGSVRPEEIKTLENASANIQDQIDALVSRVEALEKKSGGN